ncbi:MAG: YkvA family protein [Devosia sp.]|nr:YkvA family protein [Devosia sp.]
MRNFGPIARLLAFRRELVALWQAFFAPETPMRLKVLMLLVPLYLVSPIDLIPDVVPLLGWLDDMIVIPMLVSWIFRMLPQRAPVRTRTEASKQIDGTYRRL